MCSDDYGQIVLVKYFPELSISVILKILLECNFCSSKHPSYADNWQANGSELAFISLLAGENEFRYLCYPLLTV